ncbi:uncharacterized protein TNCV_879621 [Trichonephila clavipes]|nr:uncharacterized protein TNCV_879621 [Trichonephila clavipes]
MRLYEQKSAVWDGFEWRYRMGMFNYCLAEYIWRHSHGHSLSDEVSKAFLKSAVTMCFPLGKDQHTHLYSSPTLLVIVIILNRNPNRKTGTCILVSLRPKYHFSSVFLFITKMTVLIERPKMSLAMWAALKNHIMRQREKKKQDCSYVKFNFIVCCLDCYSQGLELIEDSVSGLCSNMNLKCKYCSFKAFPTTEKRNGSYLINSLIVLGLGIIGKGFSAGKKLCAFHGLPFLSKLAFHNQESILLKVIECVAQENINTALGQIKGSNNFSKCGISIDGT